MTIQRSLGVVLAFATVLAACDEDPSGPDFPRLVGNYDVDWTLTFAAGVFGFTAECEGTLSITDQDDEDFSGTFTTLESEDCEASSGTVEGEVRTDGGLNFSIDVPGAGDGDLEAITGCEVVNFDNQLNGTFVNNVITADADAVLDCPTELGVVRVNLELEVLATKT